MFRYNVKRELGGHAPTCKRCKKKIKVEAIGRIENGKRVFYHPSCFRLI